ncbi:hypothetical protein BDK51DRAFT_33495 [Blyttiomyces helicus]|uniref:Uncharacterized protein n=1 Tax=Blyttiomyces helicus TaxID=388810 RepID=A0A4P9WCH4_9FUNG|nr:hypothetical protein BDK51DRAFT_33495 [Blyttiomyces helicus]|eukprot:RKO90204.1 hypothetical protein BDK51DRAFT_33495 [Blyttiomyces helicus]
MSLLLFDKGVISQTYLNTTDPQGTDGAVPAVVACVCAGQPRPPPAPYQHEGILDFDSDNELSNLEEDEAKENLQPQPECNSAPAAVYDGGVKAEEEERRKSNSPEKHATVTAVEHVGVTTGSMVRGPVVTESTVRRSVLAKWINNMKTIITSNDGILSVANQVICVKAFAEGHFMSRVSFLGHFRLHNPGTDTSQHLIVPRGPYEKTMLLLVWFDSLIHTEGNTHPESGIIYPPASNPKALLYNNYLDHYNHVNTFSCAQFYHI